MRLRAWTAIAGALIASLSAGAATFAGSAREARARLETRRAVERATMGALTAAALDAFESKDDLRLARFVRHLRAEHPELLEA